MGRPRNFARADEIAAGVVEGYTLERVGASLTRMRQQSLDLLN